MSHTPDFSRKIREINFKRWRKQRGIKMVMSIVPVSGGRKRAIAFFEAKTYVGTGRSNTQALENCVSAIIKGAKLNT